MTPFEFQNKLHYGLSRYLSAESDNNQLAEEIAAGYQKFSNRLKNVPVCRLTLRPARLNLSDYKGIPFNQALSALFKFAKKELAPYLRYFFIHGSLASMDYAVGFSDLDTYLFVKKEVCVNPELLKNFREKLLKGRKFLKKIDPSNHHGFLCCNEANLNCYCNAYMPIPVFRHAKILLGPNKIIFNLRDSQSEYEENFFRFVKILSDRKRFDSKNIDIFQFKYFVAVLLLMPTLYLQVQNRTVYKKYSFRLFKHPFLKKLSLVRKQFGKKSLSELIKILGGDYFEQAKKMLEKMTKNLIITKKQRGYINLPSPLSLNIYRKARREVINHFKNNPDVAAIYEYGGVKAPGISDLDLIVVTNGDLKKSKLEDFIIGKNKFKHASQVAPSTLMIMNKQDFADIQLFDEIRLKKLYGEKIVLNKINSADLRLREKASVVDWLPERLTRLVALLQKPKIDVLYALRYLRSFAYVLKTASELLNDPYYAKFTDEIIKIRSMWLKGKITDLPYLIQRGIYFGYEALNCFTEKFFHKEKGPEGSLRLLPWQQIIFTNIVSNIDPDFAIAFSKEKLSSAPVSAKLLPHFWVYGQQKNLLTKQMKKKLQIKGEIDINDKNYQRFLEKKMALANRCANYLLKNGFKSGLYRFGFYFKTN